MAKLTYHSSGGFLTRTLILTMAVLLSARLLDPHVVVESNWAAIITALVIGILDNLVRPIILVVTLPLTVVTMGLFLFLVNGITIMMASGLVSGFHVESLWWAVLMSLIITAINYLLEWFRKRSSREEYQESGTTRIEDRTDEDDHFDDYEEVK